MCGNRFQLYFTFCSVNFVPYLYVFLISWFAKNSEDSVNNGHENFPQERTNLMLAEQKNFALVIFALKYQ